MARTSRASRKKTILALSVACALGALAIGLARSSDRGAPDGASTKTPSAAVAAAPAPAHRSASALARVRRAVDRANRAESEQKRRFREDGWKPVDIPPPDAEITGLDPQTLDRGDRERELQVQLQTNTYSGRMLARVTDIALQAQDAKTRAVAIESLGRSSDPAAQDELIRAYRGLDDAADRGLALEQLQPRGVDDHAAEFLISELSNPSTPPALKQQAVASLAGAAVVSGAGPEAVASRLPSSWQKEFRTVYARIRAGGGSS